MNGMTIRLGRAMSGVLILWLGATAARAELDIQGSDAEKKLINDAIVEIQKDSPTAKSVIDGLKAPGIGKVVVKIGNSADVATADTVNKVITLDNEAIKKFKLVGTGKALEQSTLPYILVHEGWHILHPGDDENATVTAINKVQTERKSATRTSYAPDTVNGRLLLPFSDGSKVDLTDALKAAGPGGAVGKFIETASGLALGGTPDPSGGIRLSLVAGTDPTLALQLPTELGGGVRSLRIYSLDATLRPAIGTDFPLTVTEFGMSFEPFEIGGVSTGLNSLGLYFDHQTPYGTWSLSAGVHEAFTFDFSGDLEWSNALFDFATGGIAVERLAGTMAYLPDSDTWRGQADLDGLKFGPVPEPSALGLLVAGLLGLAVVRRVRR